MHLLSLPKVYYAFVPGSVCVCKSLLGLVEDILKQCSPGVYGSFHSEGFPIS